MTVSSAGLPAARLLSCQLIFAYRYAHLFAIDNHAHEVLFHRGLPSLDYQMLFTTYWVRRSDQRRDTERMSLDCHFFVGRILQTRSSNITERFGSWAQL